MAALRDVDITVVHVPTALRAHVHVYVPCPRPDHAMRCASACVQSYSATEACKGVHKSTLITVLICESAVCTCHRRSSLRTPLR